MALVALFCVQVACTWDDVKSLRQDMEKSINPSSIHFRLKLLQAAAQMQASIIFEYSRMLVLLDYFLTVFDPAVKIMVDHGEPCPFPSPKIHGYQHEYP